MRTRCGRRRAASIPLDPYLAGRRRRGQDAAPWLGGPFRFGVPAADQLEFFGDDEAAALYRKAVADMETIGRAESRDRFLHLPRRGRSALFRSVGRRTPGRHPAVSSRRTRDEMNPVVREIIAGAIAVHRRRRLQGGVPAARIAPRHRSRMGAHGRAGAAHHRHHLHARSGRRPIPSGSIPTWATTRISSTCWIWRPWRCPPDSAPTACPSESRSSGRRSATKPCWLWPIASIALRERTRTGDRAESVPARMHRGGRGGRAPDGPAAQLAVDGTRRAPAEDLPHGARLSPLRAGRRRCRRKARAGARRGVRWHRESKSKSGPCRKTSSAVSSRPCRRRSESAAPRSIAARW